MKFETLEDGNNRILPSMASTMIRRHIPSSLTTTSPIFCRLFNSITPNAAADSDVLSDQSPTRPRLPALQPSPDADLISKLLLEHHNPFHAMESSLQLNGISLSSHLLHQTLLRLKNFSKVALSFFSWSLSHPYFTPDTPSFDLMIDILGRARQFDVAWQLIADLQTLNLTPNSSTFLVLIRRLIAGGFTRQAIRAFHDMHCFVESETTKEDFLYLLDTLCKYGYVRVAMEVFNGKMFNFYPCSKSYTVLIYGWCKMNRVDMAEKLLREMLEKGIEPNVVTYNVLLNGICRRASLHPDERFERVVRDADKVLAEMSERGIQPDVTSYSVVLHVYSRAHKPELTLDMFNMMKERGISPSIVTYTSVIKCLTSCARIEEADKLLDEMINNGVSPSAATYNCFFKEYGGRKDWESALSLYKRMTKEGACTPSIHTYHILLGMFLKLDKVKIVKLLWEDMKASVFGPDLDSYTILVHGLIEKQKWREACEFFVEMIEKGILPQKVTFETLYRGLIQADKLRTWRRLQKRLEQESISFGSEFEHLHLQPYKR